MSDALRYDDGKPEYDLIPPYPLEDIAKVFSMGAAKYGKGNWTKGMAWSKCVNSLLRHVQAFRKGEDTDQESGLPHMAHAAVNAIFLLEYQRTHPDRDDRWHDDCYCPLHESCTVDRNGPQHPQRP